VGRSSLTFKGLAFLHVCSGRELQDVFSNPFPPYTNIILLHKKENALFPM
jgi:hypothetical protein